MFSLGLGPICKRNAREPKHMLSVVFEYWKTTYSICLGSRAFLLQMGPSPKLKMEDTQFTKFLLSTALA